MIVRYTVRRMRIRHLTGLAGILLATAAAAPAAGAASTECSSSGRVQDVMATGTGCAQAKKVVKAYRNGDKTPLKFTCKRDLVTEGDIITECRKDNKRVSWHEVGGQ